jgi:hypothetical protein
MPKAMDPDLYVREVKFMAWRPTTVVNKLKQIEALFWL